MAKRRGEETRERKNMVGQLGMRNQTIQHVIKNMVEDPAKFSRRSTTAGNLTNEDEDKLMNVGEPNIIMFVKLVTFLLISRHRHKRHKILNIIKNFM
jgi:hypothetical protein